MPDTVVTWHLVVAKGLADVVDTLRNGAQIEVAALLGVDGHAAPRRFDDKVLAVGLHGRAARVPVAAAALHAERRPVPSCAHVQRQVTQTCDANV